MLDFIVVLILLVALVVLGNLRRLHRLCRARGRPPAQQSHHRGRLFFYTVSSILFSSSFPPSRVWLSLTSPRVSWLPTLRCVFALFSSFCPPSPALPSPSPLLLFLLISLSPSFSVSVSFSFLSFFLIPFWPHPFFPLLPLLLVSSGFSAFSLRHVEVAGSSSRFVVVASVSCIIVRRHSLLGSCLLPCCSFCSVFFRCDIKLFPPPLQLLAVFPRIVNTKRNLYISRSWQRYGTGHLAVWSKAKSSE
jgi:hypothetical protein